MGGVSRIMQLSGWAQRMVVDFASLLVSEKRPFPLPALSVALALNQFGLARMDEPVYRNRYRYYRQAGKRPYCRYCRFKKKTFCVGN
jgi:hypothetical protein